MNNKSNPGRQTPARKKKTSPPAGRPSGRSQAVRARVKSSLQYFDYSLVASIVFLVCFGLVMLYSASAYAAQVDYGNSMHYFTRQVLFCLAGAVGAYVVSLIDYHVWAKHAKKIFFFSLFLMALVQTPLGKEVNGARRWLKLPFNQQLQPAELAKIAVILFIPVVILPGGEEDQHSGGRRAGALLGRPVGGLRLLPDGELKHGHHRVRHLPPHGVHRAPRRKRCSSSPVVLGVAAVILAPVILGPLVEAGEFAGNFRLGRILVWLDPEKYSSGLGYQVVQGLYAVGSGGFFGKGLGNSAQKQFIPEVQNDMILSVICEELGVFGAIMVFLLFGLLLYRLMVIAQNAPDMYGALVAAGIFAHIALPVVLNVAVVTNVIPNTDGGALLFPLSATEARPCSS